MSISGHPTTSTTAEVRFSASDRRFPAHVVASDPYRVVVAAPLPSTADRHGPRVGEHAALVWIGATALLALPVQLVGVQQSILPLWHFRATGPASTQQRRAAVRVPIRLPVQVRGADGQTAGRTLDLSEGGAQCVVDEGSGLEPHEGDHVMATLHVHADHAALALRAEVLRARARSDGRLALALGFPDLPEADQDRLRRRVFDELRNRRALGLG